MKRLVVANWKMNFSLTDAIDCCKNISKSIMSPSKSRTIIACPSIYLSYLQGHFKDLIFASQDVTKSRYNYGEATGEISAKMIYDLGVKYSIIGHSYRRIYHNETNEIVKTKAENCINHNITPIICVGEPESVRKNNMHLQYIEKQLQESIPTSSSFILAYEPIWSIGTGNLPTILQLKEVFSLIENIIAKHVTLLYGGSVNSQNIDLIKNVNQIDGLLLGKASLNSLELKQIIENW